MLESLPSSRSPSASRGWPLLLGVLVLGACDEQGDDTGEGGDESEPLTCVDDERADAFTVNLAKSGARHTVSIVEAVPAEPTRGDNTWTVKVVDGAGNPVEGATVDVRPWMPDHGHGTPVEEQVSELDGGEYLVESLNLFMAGLWDVTFEVSTPDGEPDEVMFSICIE